VKPHAIADRLFDEFVEARARGDVDVRPFLDRAGPARERLGELIDRYLELAPVQEPDEETIVALEARLQHVAPLTAARTRRGLKVDEVVERLLHALGLPEPLRPKLRLRYQELEGEQLDPRGVHASVWDALRKILGLDPLQLVARPGPKLAAQVFLRADTIGSAPAAVWLERAETEPDAVDLLFRNPALG
jgi:hypothetical protein